MNRKGQVAYGLIFLVAIVLSVTSLFYFLSYENRFKGFSEDYSRVMSEIEFAESYVLKSSEIILRDSVNCSSEIYDEVCSLEMKKKFMAIAETKDYKYSGAGNFFGKIRSGDFSLIENGEGSKLEIRGVFVISKMGDNEVIRRFDVESKNINGDLNIFLIRTMHPQSKGDNSISVKSLDSGGQELSFLKGENSYGLISGGSGFKEGFDNVELLYISHGVNTNIYFREGVVYAKGYSGIDYSIGKYDSKNNIKIDNLGTLKVPLGEREVLNEISDGSYSDLKGGNLKLQKDLYFRENSISSNNEVVWTMASAKFEDFNSYSDQIESEGGYSCGPSALREAFARLGKEVDSKELLKYRADGKGLVRDFLSIFDKQSRQITWPSEMRKAIIGEGFKYETISGRNVLDKADKILADSDDFVIIVRVEFEGLFQEHWTIYDGNDIFYDDSARSARSYKINEVLVVSKS